MSYTPDNQLLEGALERFILASEDVRERMQNRLDADDWSDEHIEELHNITQKLYGLELRLRKLKKETR